MAPTAALVTVREPDGRTVYINQERMAELFIRPSATSTSTELSLPTGSRKG
jgi:hypothetical protein